jgi:regulator of protease activity HflC (stomatin/prohibitin superfamily)
MFESVKSSPRFRPQIPGVSKLRGGVLRTLLLGLAVVLPLLMLRACVFTYVPPDEIGIRQVAFGPGRGLHKEPVRPGWRRAVSGLERIRTFPRDVQVVEFTNSPAEKGSAGHRQVAAIKVPTVDGYPVDVDVTVLYRIIDPYKVVSRFGFGNAYEEAVVIRFTDPLVKQHLGELLAEQFYGAARLRQVAALKQALAARFAAAGLELADVLLRQYDYPETFQTLTEQKKIQDQAVLANREFTKQAEVETRLKQVKAEGENLIKVRSSEFEAQITEIIARKELYERQRRAEADLLVRTAEANGTEAINRALEGAGSAKLLRLRRGLALLNSIRGPIYISEDPTDLGRLGSGNER